MSWLIWLRRSRTWSVRRCAAERSGERGRGTVGPTAAGSGAAGIWATAAIAGAAADGGSSESCGTAVAQSAEVAFAVARRLCAGIDADPTGPALADPGKTDPGVTDPEVAGLEVDAELPTLAPFWSGAAVGAPAMDRSHRCGAPQPSSPDIGLLIVLRPVSHLTDSRYFSQFSHFHATGARPVRLPRDDLQRGRSDSGHMPVVTFLGHAGLRVEARGWRLLADPWFARTGAFLGAWHQFPRNDHLDTPDMLDVDWVAVSHEHLDHMDLSVLTLLPERTRVLIPRYPSSAFRDRLLEGGVARVVELEPWQPFPLDTHGSWITAIPEHSPMCHDAALLIVADDHSILNCNDARLTAAQARRAKHLVGGRLDVMTVQTSGASWHPICYAYPAEVRQQIEAEKRISKFRSVLRLVRATAPELAVPFAGPPCFLDPELRHFNDSLRPPGVFPDAEQATAWLREHAPRQDWACFRPGDRLDLATGAVTRDPVSARFSYTEGLAEYLDRYAADRADAIASVHAAAPAPGPELAELFRAHFSRLGTLSPYFLTRIGMTVRFEVTGEYGGVWDVRMDADGLTVDLDAGTGAGTEAGTEAGAAVPEYTFRVAGRWLGAVLSGRVAWEDLLLSLRLTARRDPDRYNDYLIGLLKHANEPALRAIEEYETGRERDERIVVRDGERSYEIGRYCPHAGEDLAVGSIVDDGVLHCLAHNFRFSLETGECVNARCERLTSRPLAAEFAG